MVTRRTAIGALGAWMACPAPGRGAAAFRFGLTPVFLSDDIRLTSALRLHLEMASGLRVDLVTKRTYQEITALLLSGELDAAWICGYPYVRHRPALDLVAAPVWRGRPLYRSYLIVAANRPAGTLTDLRGDVHAFSDPDSNSGFLVTQAALARAGEDPGAFFGRVFFTYGHRNVIRAVASGLAGSGSVDGYVWEAMVAAEPHLVGMTRVLSASDWLGFPPIAAPRARRGAPGQAEFRAALLDMGRNAAGREALALLQLDGFAPAEPALYDGIAGLLAELGGRG